MATVFATSIRERIYSYLSAAGAALPAHEADEPVRVSWLVSGSQEEGIAASFSDADDVIEFGLLSRAGGEPTNVLNASIVVDAEEARIFCASDTNGEMNFQGWIKPEASADGLFLACDYFSQVVGASALAV